MSSTTMISRSDAIKFLQLTLSDFQRLCILKGVYPKDAKKASKAAKVHYAKKDIQWIQHDPLINSFRSMKINDKKMRKAHGRLEPERAQKLFENRPLYSLSHVVKQRYPTFSDALRDLDDNLCNIALFANIPVHHPLARIHDTRIRNCQRILQEFHYYVTVTHSLRKVFCSIKGYYIQAEINGEKVVWLLPHMKSHKLPSDVDYAVLSTFLEFSEAMVSFVLFKLYHNIGLFYPPKVNDASFEQGIGTLSLICERISDSSSIDETTPSDAKSIEEDFSLLNMANEQHSYLTLAETKRLYSQLFKGCVIFISRENPVPLLEFIITSFGGIPAWEGVGSPYKIDDAEITHHIVDRPFPDSWHNGTDWKTEDGVLVYPGRKPEVVYVQPQWIFDSINNLCKLPDSHFAPNMPLPPHLSPFVTYEETDHVPEHYHTIQKWISEIKGVDPELQEDEDEGSNQPVSLHRDTDINEIDRAALIEESRLDDLQGELLNTHTSSTQDDEDEEEIEKSPYLNYHITSSGERKPIPDLTADRILDEDDDIDPDTEAADPENPFAGRKNPYSRVDTRVSKNSFAVSKVEKPTLFDPKKVAKTTLKSIRSKRIRPSELNLQKVSTKNDSKQFAVGMLTKKKRRVYDTIARGEKKKVRKAQKLVLKSKKKARSGR